MLHMEGIDGGYVVVERNAGRAALQLIAAVLGRSQTTNQDGGLTTLAAPADNGSCKVRCNEGQLWIKVSSGTSAIDLPLDVWRKARIVLTAPKSPPMTAFERQCAAAIDFVKDAYLQLTKIQFSSFDQSRVNLNPVLWDFKVSLVSSFIKLLVDECGRSDVPLEQRLALGFHGTPTVNTDNILKNGFDPAKNTCHSAGAYFTGQFSYASSYVRTYKCSDQVPSDVLIVALVRGHEMRGTSSACDELRRISAQQVVIPETHALPLASIRVPRARLRPCPRPPPATLTVA